MGKWCFKIQNAISYKKSCVLKHDFEKNIYFKKYIKIMF